MQNYVISLKIETKRREHINSQFGKQNIQFSFFDALTPDTIKPIATKIGIDIDNQALTKGELACFMSHISLWHKMIDENIPYMAIFEDDVHLGENANAFLNGSEWIPKKCDIIKLEAFYKKILVDKLSRIRLNQDRSLFILKSKHLGGAGYILSQQAARILLIEVKNQKNSIKPLDHLIFEDCISHKELNIMQMQPAICIQDYILHDSHERFQSSLEIERRKRFSIQTKSLSLLEKIKRELVRLIMQIVKLKNKILTVDVTYK